MLTGAGLSADSGIPTFRDADGFWTAGSVNYTPEEMGTFRMFWKKPLEVWKWFLYRHTICAPAQPNAGHHAITELEKIFGDRFTLISQNVDGRTSRPALPGKERISSTGHSRKRAAATNAAMRYTLSHRLLTGKAIR